MEKTVLVARSRLAKDGLVKLRSDGRMPAVVYGHGKKSEAIDVDVIEAEKVHRQAGNNKIIGLKIDDQRMRNVLFYDAQRESIKGHMLHADFYLVKMNEELRAEVPFHFFGESTAVYRDKGILLTNMEVVEVECLPANLPDSFAVDISALDEFDKAITLRDLQLPEGVRLVGDDLDTVIVKVEAPRSDEEIADLEVPIASELPEGVQEEAPEVIADVHEEDADRLTMK
jgi:large subunit ribosomal protein L25